MRYDDSLRALVELAASRHNAFTTSEAAELHVSRQRLRRAELQGILTRLYPSVWSFSDLPSTREQHARAAVLSVRGSALTTTSAAWLYGWIDVPPRCPQLWTENHRTRAHPQADIRRWQRVDPARDLTTCREIAVLNKAAALCSLGPHVDERTLERCLDEYLRTESPRWLTQNMDRLDSTKPGGVRALRRIISAPHRQLGVTESWFETVLASLLRHPQLPQIVRQHEVIVAGRRHRIDLACPSLKLGIEAHSKTFHWGPRTEDADNVRELRLASVGWQLVYVTWAQIAAPEAFVGHFLQAVRARADQLGVDIARR